MYDALLWINREFKHDHREVKKTDLQLKYVMQIMYLTNSVNKVAERDQLRNLTMIVCELYLSRIACLVLCLRFVTLNLGAHFQT